MLSSTAFRRLAATASVSMVALSAGVAPALAATPAWSIQTTPQPTAPQGRLTGVSCSSTISCIAVGSNERKTGQVVPMAQTWNGSKWAIVATPSPAGATSSFFSGVSCASPTACTAVGTTGKTFPRRTTLAERWDGTSWSLQATPNPTGAVSSSLSGIVCMSPTACTAVGFSSPNSSGTGQTTLVEAWNGSVWTIQPSPNPTGVSSSLNGISCTSSTACTAVGATLLSTTTNASQTLAERWNGSAWTIQTTPNPTGATQSFLFVVRCSSATMCIAGGYSRGSNGASTTLAESWNGTAWTIAATPNPTGSGLSILNGMDCSSSAACTGVGLYQSSTGGILPLAERWNGSTWSIQPVPAPTGTTTAFLSGVACVSSVQCTAVGTSFGTAIETPVTLAEAWNGTAWTVRSTPNLIGATTNRMAGVSCASSTACTAVGSRSQTPLAEGWNGSSWTIQAAPSPAGASSAMLNGVSCTSSGACEAVGSTSPTTNSVNTLAEVWNGTSWSIQTTPNPTGAKFSILYGVSCASPTACFAAGQFKGSSSASPFIEMWNGTSWAIQSTPAAVGAGLFGVSCTSASACTAVGGTGGATLAERWNGTAWSIQATPNPSSTNNALVAVSCTSSTSCVAVGNSVSSTFTTAPFAETWNGTTWTLVTMPLPAGVTNASVSGASCGAVTSCEAIGRILLGQGQRPLAESWNGTTWTVQSVPSPTGAAFTSLAGVSCSAANTCTAVGGFSYPDGSSLGLAERFM